MNRKFCGRTVCLFLTAFLTMPSNEKQSVPFVCGVETLLSSPSASFGAMMHLHLLPKKLFLKYCLIIDSLHKPGPEPVTSLVLNEKFFQQEQFRDQIYCPGLQKDRNPVSEKNAAPAPAA